MKLITTPEGRGGVYTVCGVSLPERDKNSHKYNYGCDLIVGGCIGYTGAPMYSAEAASRSGAGLVLMGVPEKIYQIEAAKADSAMPFPLPDDGEGKLSVTAYSKIQERFEKISACLIGPGMGKSSGTEALTLNIIRNYDGQIILDADGINVIAGHIDVLGYSKRPMILTPHMGEFARLGGDTDSEPLDAARRFASEHRCILVLKGHRTVTAFPDGDAFINTTGGPGLAKGGSGDVLSGIILSFVGQGFPLKAAVPGAVYVHGLAGDLCESELGEYSVLPGDVIGALPRALLQK